MKKPNAAKQAAASQGGPNLTFRRSTQPLENAAPETAVWKWRMFTLDIFVDRREVGKVQCIQRQFQSQITAARSWHNAGDWNIDLDIDNRSMQWTVPGRISQTEVLAEVRAWIVDRVDPPRRRTARRSL